VKKIPTLFVRDFSEPSNGRWVTDEVNVDCEWALAGEGVPTRKYDGTCVLLDENGWWSRREVKPGKQPPKYYRSVETDEVTGKTVGWEPIDQSAFIKFFREAFEADRRHDGIDGGFALGTYELVGPKVNGNPERFDTHRLLSHADAEILDLTEDGTGPWSVDEIKHAVRWGAERGWEGIVWHHRDGRMAKLKARDLPAEDSVVPTV
jgi:hypothetical protein